MRKKQPFCVPRFRSIDEIVQKERFYKDSFAKSKPVHFRISWDMITSALPGGVKISNDDPEYSFKYVSEHFAQMLGYDTSKELMEASGGTIADLAHPDDLEQGIAQALEQYSKADHYGNHISNEMQKWILEIY